LKSIDTGPAKELLEMVHRLQVFVKQLNVKHSNPATYVFD